MRTNISTLVTLDTVFQIPNGHIGCDTAFFVSGSTLVPSTIFHALEGTHGKVVTHLCIDDASNVSDECRSAIVHLSVVSERSPSGIYGEFLIFATAIYGCVVLFYHVLTLLAVSLFDEVFHLLDSLVHRNHVSDAEEGTLKDGVGAIAKTNFTRNLCCVDGVDRDVALSKDALNLVGHIAHEVFTFPKGVEEECAVGLNTAQHVIHMHIALHVASHKVGGVHQIGRTDGVITEAKVRASETTRLLRVVREVGLTVLIGCFTDDFHRVLVSTNSTVSTEAIELSLEQAFTAKADFFFGRK